MAAVVLIAGRQGGGGTDTQEATAEKTIAGKTTSETADAGTSERKDKRKERPKALAAQVLALPSLAPKLADTEGREPLFRPTGKVTAKEEVPLANGGKRVRVAVEVESRSDASQPLAPSTILMDVVTDARGWVLSGTTVGAVDADDAFLESLAKKK